MKTILVAVSGMSPAIITETLWALSRESPTVVPDEVVVITTLQGKTGIESQLLASRPDWGNRSVWDTLRQDIFRRCQLPAKSDKLQLSVKVIELKNPETGVKDPASDVRSPADNAEAADFILQTLSYHVGVADQSVVASIAGGRKTMGALLYAAMSLIGRETDRVTHVLVNESLETCRGFFYPDQPVRDLMVGPPGNQTPVRADEAVVDLADVPFVPLRNGFADLGEPQRSFDGLVQWYSRGFMELAGPPVVRFDEAKSRLEINGRPIPLAGREIPVAGFLLERARRKRPHYGKREDAVSDLKEWAKSWKVRNPGAAGKTPVSSLNEGDISNALSELRKKMTERGLEAFVSHLAPERSRIGFDILHGEE